MANAAGMARGNASRGQPMIVAVAHQKGGSGKTTTACNLGIEMARRLPSGTVAIIDLDPQCSASQHLSPDEDGAFGGSYELLCGTRPLLDLVRPTQARRTLLVPAGPRLTLAEIDPALRELSHLRLRKLLTQDAGNIACIILDCPPGFGGLATVAAMTADLILVPSPTLRFAEAALGKGARLIESLRADGRERVFLLPTMTDADDPVQAVTEQRLRGTWEDHVFTTCIPYDSAAERAASTGVPVVLHEPRSPMALAYKQAAKELHLLLDPTQDKDTGPSGAATTSRREPVDPAADAWERHSAEMVAEPDPPRHGQRWPWGLLLLAVVALSAGGIVALLEGEAPVFAGALLEDWITRGRALLFDARVFFDGLLRSADEG